MFKFLLIIKNGNYSKSAISCLYYPELVIFPQTFSRFSTYGGNSIIKFKMSYSN